MKSVVSEKGQVTIPKKLRQQLGLTAGAILEFREDKGKLIGEKKVEECPFEKWVGKGRLPIGKNTDEYLETIRGR